MSVTLAASAFMLGLVSAPHCATMCGGIVAASQLGVGKRRLPQARPSALIVVAQNAGRIGSYTLAGVLAGGMGAIAGRSTLASVRDALQLIAALALLAAGLTLAGLVPSRASLERLGTPLWRLVSPLGRRLLPIDTLGRAALFGVIWGLLPCGLVYSSLSLAMVSGSLTGGAAVMFAFGLGTVPALVSMGALAGSVAVLVRGIALRRTAGALIIAFGVLELGLAVRAIESRTSDPASCHQHVVSER